MKIVFGFIGKKGFLLNKIQQQRGYETFLMLERINDNAYKLDLSTAYGEEFDLRTNPFEEGGNDRDPTNKVKDPLRDTRGSLTMPKINMMKQSLQDLSVGKMKSLIVVKMKSLMADGKMESLIARGKMESLIVGGKMKSLIAGGKMGKSFMNVTEDFYKYEFYRTRIIVLYFLMHEMNAETDFPLGVHTRMTYASGLSIRRPQGGMGSELKYGLSVRRPDSNDLNVGGLSIRRLWGLGETELSVRRSTPDRLSN
ncbi:hypothetical protein CR513_15854, partial [Mucuna pruriens]